MFRVSKRINFVWKTSAQYHLVCVSVRDVPVRVSRGTNREPWSARRCSSCLRWPASAARWGRWQTTSWSGWRLLGTLRARSRSWRGSSSNGPWNVRHLLSGLSLLQISTFFACVKYVKKTCKLPSAITSPNNYAPVNYSLSITPTPLPHTQR